ncbi:MAG: hypothetical protein ABIT83_12300 [Massilia sp.]
MKTNPELDRKLRAHLLLRPVEGDRLMLADAVLHAALDGTRPLTPGERAALEGSPLTLRRFRQLALDRRAATDAAWNGSAGMLRAASGGELTALTTDDRYWTLHFVPDDGRCQVILKLAADAPFAPRLMREQPMLRVLDGGGAIILQGRLDTDGECESTWPFSTEPAPHFQQFDARFAVEPVRS